jgi:hypothetical protein
MNKNPLLSDNAVDMVKVVIITAFILIYILNT